MRTRTFLLILLLTASPAAAFPPPDELEDIQAHLSVLPLGERIAAWAERFVGTPYDPDPDGSYVTRRSVVADDRVDCMYHIFRSVELALSGTPEEAAALALDLRFITRGRLEEGRVANYDDRFRYALDMLLSGKWGADVTARLGPTVVLPGSRGVEIVRIIAATDIPEASARLRSGDIVYFVKNPDRRVVGEVVGHLGIIKRESADVFLIHASGRKNEGGRVRKTPLAEYAQSMPFAGIMVGRFGVPGAPGTGGGATPPR